jgi:threonine-phosphate decarboxylase
MVMYQHGGNVYSAAEVAGCHVDEIMDLSSNVSPFTSEALLKGLNIKSIISRLPEPFNNTLTKAVAKYHDLPEEYFLTGSGTTEFIHRICEIYAKKRAVIVQPTYVDYMKHAELAGMDIQNCILSEKHGFAFDDNELMQYLPEADICFICNPNNPTGVLIGKDELRFLADMFKKTMFVVDESYIDFCMDSNPTFIGCNLSNIIVLRSFSKAYGIPGLRAGYVFSMNRHLLAEIKVSMSPWNINTLAQEVCLKALKLDISSYMRQLKQIKGNTLSKLAQNDNLKIIRGETNYILIRLNKSDASSFCEYMLNHKILVRNCTNFVGLSDKYIRIGVKEQEQMDTFCRLADTYFRIFS